MKDSGKDLRSVSRWLVRLAALALLWLSPQACNSPPKVVKRNDVVAGRAVSLERWEYRVGPGDVLRVNVFARPELSSQLLGKDVYGSPVEGNGEIMLPLVGAIPVAGATVAEVAARVTEALRPYLKDPHVDVAVSQFGAHRYLVLGEVRTPGTYPLSRPVTPLEAIALAGGMASFANRENVAWVRGTLDRASLVLLDASQLDPLATQLVEPGDVIFVGRRRWADLGEAARELIPVLQTVSIPLSIAIQAATLEKIR